MKVLVIGATGHVGSHIARRIVRAGHAVSGTARSVTAAEHVAALGALPVAGDLMESGAFDQAIGDADAIVYAAQLLLEPEHDTIAALVERLADSRLPGRIAAPGRYKTENEMRAAVVDALNTVPCLSDVPEPPEMPGASRISVEWAGLQPTDVLRVRGTYKSPVFPYIVGGEGVGRLADGTRVYFGHSIPQQGAMSEITMVPDAEIWPIPEDVDAQQVIALALAGIGAIIPLEEARIQPGERVLILGVTGPVGQIGALVARQLGAGTIVGAARSLDALQRLNDRGIVDAIVQLGQGDDDNALVAEKGERGYDVVLDPLFGAPAEAAMRSVAEGGRLMSIGTRAGRTMTLTLTELRRRHHHGVDTGELIRSAAERQAAFERLLAYAKAGNWSIDTVTYPLEHIQVAWAAQNGSPHAKILIKVAHDD